MIILCGDLLFAVFFTSSVARCLVLLCRWFCFDFRFAYASRRLFSWTPDLLYAGLFVDSFSHSRCLRKPEDAQRRKSLARGLERSGYTCADLRNDHAAVPLMESATTSPASGISVRIFSHVLGWFVVTLFTVSHT